MDVSETYVRMCDCLEIQCQKRKTPCFINLEDGDWIQNHRGRVVVVAYYPGRKKRPLIWLPRQDQIQEMIRDYYAEGVKPVRLGAWFPKGMVGLTYILKKFNEFAPSDGIIAHEVESFEQLWLAFYMHEKHGKTWNGSEWALS